jgi:hypothetical protein
MMDQIDARDGKEMILEAKISVKPSNDRGAQAKSFEQNPEDQVS